MKKYHLNVILFLLILGVFALLNLFQTDRPTVSQLENRALKAKPALTLSTLFDGSYLKDLEEYYADTFVFRETWVRLANDLESLRGFTDDTGAVFLTYNNNVADTMVGPEPEMGGTAGESDDYGTTAPETSQGASGEPSGQSSNASPEIDGPVSVIISPDQSPDRQAQPQATPEENQPEVSPPPSQEPLKETPSSTPRPEDLEPKKVGGLLIANGRAMETHYFQDSFCKVYAETLNAFQEKLPEGVKVYSLVAPTSIEFYNVDKYKDITAPQDRTIATINGYFNAGITPVDAYTPISEHRDEYLYFRTDHHWTATGAYYAYTGLMKALGEEPVPLSRYETEEVEGYLGSLYQSTLNRALQSNPDTIVIYKPFTPHEYHIYYDGPIKMNIIDKNRLKDQNKYRVFMSGDRPWSVIKTDVANGKKIVIIKDSYGNAMIPFLLPHFSEIYTVDPRQYKNNVLELIEEQGIEHVLFLNYVNATGQTSFLDLITQMTQR